MKILIAVPTFENILPDTFKSIYNLEKTEDMIVDFDFVRGYDCARARNKICNNAIENNYDYVLMVDSDVILPSYTLNKMLNDPKPICLGCYPRKNTKTGVFEVFKLGQQDYVNTFDYGEITSLSGKVEIKGGGFGCSMIDVKILQDLSHPFFKYVEYESGATLSEDLYFCSNARDKGYQIYMDTDVICGHSTRGFQWR